MKITKEEVGILDQNVKRIPIAVKQQVVSGFPKINLTESDFNIKDGFSFSSITYVRPKGSSNQGVASVELISKLGDIFTFEIEIDFLKTEKQRIEDAKRPERFKINPSQLITKQPDKIKPTDIVHKYSDVIIDDVNFIRTSDNPSDNSGDLQIDFHFRSSVFSKDKESPKKFKVFIPLDFGASNEELAKFSTTSNLNPISTDSGNWEIEEGIALTVDQLVYYKISPEFLRGAPPITVSPSALIPMKGISFKKVDYFPPKTIHDTVAHFNVQYYLGDRIWSERVTFSFSKSIADAASTMVNRIDQNDIVYLKNNAKVPPTFMRANDFEYRGDLAFQINDVNYHYETIDPDDRYVNVELFVTFRTVPVKYIKRIEFQFSKNEYIAGNWHDAKTENGSVRIAKKFHKAEVLFELNKGSTSLQKELVKTSKIIDGYDYEEIKDIKVINFLRDSRTAMFKLHVVERVGNEGIHRVFEKQIEMIESYDEWKLSTISDSDVKINEAVLPPYPPSELSDTVIKEHDDFNVLSIQYIRPSMEDKEMEIQVKISAGKKVKYVTKKIVRKMSKIEYERMLWERESYDYLKIVEPSSLSVSIDMEQEPPRHITKEQVIGIPESIDFEVYYIPPQIGSIYSRFKLRLHKAGRSLVYEQSLEFGKPRTWI